MTNEVCRVVPKHQWPEHDGKIVLAIPAGDITLYYNNDDTIRSVLELFATDPPLRTIMGTTIMWQRRHLVPLTKFSREELMDEEIKHFLRTL